MARFDKDDFGGEGPTADLEILRGDLARIVYEACDGIERRFGDSIASVTDEGGEASFTFESGKTERFDLVVSAEGVGSSTRALLWGKDAHVEPFGLSSAFFSIPKGHGDGKDARWFNAPGGRSVFLRPDPQGTTRVVLSLEQQPQGWDDLPTEEQKRLIAERYADAGWETQRVLDGMMKTDDFYFHSIALVKTDAYHRGRIVLTGDAAWAAMGLGTTLALVGPYVLAGELQRNDDLSAALDRYDEITRTFVEPAQDLPSWGPKALQPRTKLGIGVQRTMLKLFASRVGQALAGRFAQPSSKLPDLPDYPGLR